MAWRNLLRIGKKFGIPASTYPSVTGVLVSDLKRAKITDLFPSFSLSLVSLYLCLSRLSLFLYPPLAISATSLSLSLSLSFSLSLYLFLFLSLCLQYRYPALLAMTILRTNNSFRMNTNLILAMRDGLVCEMQQPAGCCEVPNQGLKKNSLR